MVSTAREREQRRSSPSPRRRRCPIPRSSPRVRSPRASSARSSSSAARGSYADPGVAFGVRLGYDLFRWLDVQAHVMGASSNAATPPPQLGQSFQTYLYAGEVRLKLQIHRFQLFAEGGAALGADVEQRARPGGRHARLALHASRSSAAAASTTTRSIATSPSGSAPTTCGCRTFTGGHALSLDAYLRYTR